MSMQEIHRMTSKENIIMNTNDKTKPKEKADSGAKLRKNRLMKIEPHKDGVQGLEQFC